MISLINETDLVAFETWFTKAILSGRNCLTVSPRKVQILPCGCPNNVGTKLTWVSGIGFIHSTKDQGCGKNIKNEKEFFYLISEEKKLRREEKTKKRLKRFEKRRNLGYFADCHDYHDRLVL